MYDLRGANPFSTSRDASTTPTTADLPASAHSDTPPFTPNSNTLPSPGTLPETMPQRVPLELATALAPPIRAFPIASPTELTTTLANREASLQRIRSRIGRGRGGNMRSARSNVRGGAGRMSRNVPEGGEAAESVGNVPGSMEFLAVLLPFKVYCKHFNSCTRD
jgi:hypothetical protein